MAIFTVGYRNRFGNPKADIVDRYSRRGIRTYCSDVDGTVLLRFNEKEGLIA
jgi:competence protein ComEC